MASLGFQIDFAAWDLKNWGGRQKLIKWTGAFFVDGVWTCPTVFVGWLRETHTAKGLRQLLTNNLGNWHCPKVKRYQCGWVVALSVEDFKTQTGRLPQPVQDSIDRTAAEIRKKTDKLAAEALQHERAAMRNADIDSKQVERREKDPYAFDERQRVLREERAMFMEDRQASRIRDAEGHQPNQKRRRLGYHY